MNDEQFNNILKEKELMIKELAYYAKENIFKKLLRELTVSDNIDEDLVIKAFQKYLRRNDGEVTNGIH